jgi:U3 small nucleolar RNA-associated protein 10
MCCPCVCLPGLATLTQSDKRFKPFADSLFNRSSVHASREQLTAQENDALNANIAAFLRVLTNFFLAAPAFQVLEYCIRRYK